MSNYPLRPRKRQPTRRIDVAKRIQILTGGTIAVKPA
jgi:hypothetical protein